MANIQRPVFADGLSTQPDATPDEKKTLQAVWLWLMHYLFKLTLQDFPLALQLRT